jgi:general L-amino acid transport system permease protein
VLQIEGPWQGQIEAQPSVEGGGLIGQLISLFKDTTLAGIAMSLFELLRVSEAITAQPDFRGQGLIGETITFAALMFWTVSYTMSRESQRLERRLGVGIR